MRASRIAHPPGGRYLQIHHWQVREVGFAPAAVVAEIDFHDRRATEAGQVAVTRAELVGALQGMVGRNAVDAALKTLCVRGWILRREVQTIRANLTTTHEYVLCPEAIRPPGSPASRNRDTGDPRIGPDTGTETGTPSMNKTREKKRELPPRAGRELNI